VYAKISGDTIQRLQMLISATARVISDRCRFDSITDYTRQAPLASACPVQSQHADVQDAAWDVTSVSVGLYTSRHTGRRTLEYCVLPSKQNDCAAVSHWLHHTCGRDCRSIDLMDQPTYPCLG
jgi:hypothetical protein